MQFLEDAKLAGIRKLRDGFLHANVNVAREGIQEYLGDEVGRPDKPRVKVFRPASEVKDVKSVVTYSHTPVTIGHPGEMVTADNWKKYAVGEISTEAEWNDGKIKLPLILKDADAIRLVESGTRELSAGYICSLDWTPGEYNGEKYDAVQREIRINHVAIVPRGRAGKECRIGDAVAARWGATPINGENEMTTKAVVIGDRAVNIPADDAEFVEKIVGRVKAQDAELAVKDGEIADLKSKLETAEAKLNDTADLDARAEARATLIDTARKLVPTIQHKGLSDQEIKEKVVAARRGEAAIKDKSAEYISAAFDFLAEDAQKMTQRPDPVRRAVGDNRSGNVVSMQDAQIAYERALETAWQGETK